jgi:hypothetical protein
MPDLARLTPETDLRFGKNARRTEDEDGVEWVYLWSDLIEDQTTSILSREVVFLRC